MKGPPKLEKPKRNGPPMLEEPKLNGSQTLEKPNMIVPSTLEKPRRKGPPTLEKPKFRGLIGREMFLETSMVEGPKSNVPRVLNICETNTLRTSNFSEVKNLRGIRVSRTSNYCETNVPGTSNNLEINVPGASNDRETNVPGASNSETSVPATSNDLKTKVTGASNDPETNVPGTSHDLEITGPGASKYRETNAQGASIASNVREINFQSANVPDTYFQKTISVSENTSDVSETAPIRRSHGDAIQRRRLRMRRRLEWINEMTRSANVENCAELDRDNIVNQLWGNHPNKCLQLKCGNFEQKLEKYSSSTKFCHEIEPSCQNIGSNNPPNANKAASATADVQNTSELSQQNGTRNCSLRCLKNRCRHYPNVCPCKKSSDNWHKKSFSDPNCYRELDDCEITDFQKQQKVINYSLKRKSFPKKGLKAVKELDRIRKVCMQDAVTEKQKENNFILRRTASKRKRIQQAKRERQQLRRVDQADVNGVFNKIDYFRDTQFIGIKWNGDWKKRLDLNRYLLEKLIRREEKILQYFVTEGIIGYNIFRRRSQDDLIQCMFDIVIESGEEGYKYFLKALRDTNQDHVVQLLEVEDFKLNISHQAVITTNWTTLVSDLSTDGELLNYLIPEKLLSDEEIQVINHLPTRSMKNIQLLDYICRSSIEQFELFRNAIKKASSEHISDILELR